VRGRLDEGWKMLPIQQKELGKLGHGIHRWLTKGSSYPATPATACERAAQTRPAGAGPDSQGWQDSNPRHSVLETDALPLRYASTWVELHYCSERGSQRAVGLRKRLLHCDNETRRIGAGFFGAVTRTIGRGGANEHAPGPVARNERQQIHVGPSTNSDATQ
jgi:hypothetical protein